MRGLPKRFNTLDDVKNSMAMDPEGTKKKLRELIDNRFCWVATGILASKEEGVTDDTHKVVEEKGLEEGAPVKFVQLERQEDPHAWLFKLGLTLNEARAMAEV